MHHCPCGYISIYIYICVQGMSTGILVTRRLTTSRSDDSEDINRPNYTNIRRFEI